MCRNCIKLHFETLQGLKVGKRLLSAVVKCAFGQKDILDAG